VALALSALALQFVAQDGAPHVYAGLTRGGGAIAVQGTTALVSLAAFVALTRRYFRAARVLAVLQGAFIIAGWALAQYPYIVPEVLTIEAAAAPTVTLRLLIIALAAGTVVLVPSLWYLFKVFNSPDR